MEEIKLQKNNDSRDWEDIQWVQEFYEFLQGNVPDGLDFKKGYQPKMSSKKAFSIIWYLQEHFPIIPDKIERCNICEDLYDSYRSGYYEERTGKHYCSGCDHLAEYLEEE